MLKILTFFSPFYKQVQHCFWLQDVTDTLTHSVMEHQGYQDALEEAERALFDISQQLTVQGSLPDGESLEDNQQQLSQLQVSYSYV